MNTEQTTSESSCSKTDPISMRAAWNRVLGLAAWADMIRTHMDYQASLRKMTDKPCPYCTSDNDGIRETYFDQTCKGCVLRMGSNQVLGASPKP